jgi:hypothetical protein
MDDTRFAPGERDALIARIRAAALTGAGSSAEPTLPR